MLQVGQSIQRIGSIPGESFDVITLNHSDVNILSTLNISHEEVQGEISKTEYVEISSARDVLEKWGWRYRTVELSNGR